MFSWLSATIDISPLDSNWRSAATLASVRRYFAMHLGFGQAVLCDVPWLRSGGTLRCTLASVRRYFAMHLGFGQAVLCDVDNVVVAPTEPRQTTQHLLTAPSKKSIRQVPFVRCTRSLILLYSRSYSLESTRLLTYCPWRVESTP